MDLNNERHVPFYERNGISIGQPRMQADAAAGDSREVEYQYSFHRSNERLTVLGLYGIEYFLEESGHYERLFTIDLSDKVALLSALKAKPILGSIDDDFVYLCQLSEGLLDGFRQATGGLVDRTYRVFSRPESLAHLNIRTPENVAVNADGTITLAEAFIPSDAG